MSNRHYGTDVTMGLLDVMISVMNPDYMLLPNATYPDPDVDMRVVNGVDSDASDRELIPDFVQKVRIVIGIMTIFHHHHHHHHHRHAGLEHMKM